MFNFQYFSFKDFSEVTFFPSSMIHRYSELNRHCNSNRDYYRVRSDVCTPFLDEFGQYQVANYELIPYTQEEKEAMHQESLRCSVSRTKKRIRHLALSFSPVWFCTFTFNKDYVNRYCYDDCKALLSSFLRTLPPDIQYVIVPEHHKDGAFHFHGLFSSQLPVVYAGVFKRKHTFHVQGFYYGFTSAFVVKNPMRIVLYMLKYITKDLVSLTPRKHRYLYSRSTLTEDMIDKRHFVLSDDSWHQLFSLLQRWNINIFDSDSSEHPSPYRFCRAVFPHDLPVSFWDAFNDCLSNFLYCEEYFLKGGISYV